MDINPEFLFAQVNIDSRARLYGRSNMRDFYVSIDGALLRNQANVTKIAEHVMLDTQSRYRSSTGSMLQAEPTPPVLRQVSPTLLVVNFTVASYTDLSIGIIRGANLNIYANLGEVLREPLSGLHPQTDFDGNFHVSD